MPQEFRLGPEKKVVLVPDEIAAAFDRGEISKNGIRDFAVSSGQARPADIGLEESRIGARNPLDATLLQAGRRSIDLLDQTKRLFGDPAASERLAERERLAAPIQEEFPVASFIGGALPSAAVPGGKVVQLGVGALEGVLEGDDLQSRLIGGGTGLAFGLLGQKLGDQLVDNLSRRFQQLTRRTNFPARRDAALIGADLPISGRISADSFIGRFNRGTAKFFENIKDGIVGSQLSRGQQQRALARAASSALPGERVNKLTPEYMASVTDELGKMYDDVANQIDNFLVRDADLLDAMDNLADEALELADKTSVGKLIAKTADELSGNISGSRFKELRRKLVRASLSADTTDADLLHSAVDTMHEMLKREVPDAAETLTAANQGWQFLKFLRSPNVISPAGEINTRSAAAAAQRFWPDFDLRRVSNPVAKPFALGLKAIRELDPGKADLTAQAIRSGFLTSLTGGLALAGGGAGGQLGGALGRSLSRETSPLLQELLLRQQAQDTSGQQQEAN